MPDVALVPYDAAVTEIALPCTGVQVARGSQASDDDGERQATLLEARVVPRLCARVSPFGVTQQSIAVPYQPIMVAPIALVMWSWPGAMSVMSGPSVSNGARSRRRGAGPSSV